MITIRSWNPEIMNLSGSVLFSELPGGPLSELSSRSLAVADFQVTSTRYQTAIDHESLIRRRVMLEIKTCRMG